MQKTRRSAVDTPVIKATPVALALAAMLVLCSPADAASIGHSRLLSKPGQPLRIDVPIRGLNDADIQSLKVRAAPSAAWQQAGLVPPVELSSLLVNVGKGFSPNSRVVQVSSSQPFDGPVADLLLQVETAAGSQQHQVSLLAYASGASAVTAGQASPSTSSGQRPMAGAPASDSSSSASQSISVRRGDTLFALASANAVQGVSVYQMMLALQRANPQAFIDGNMNLVKAGAKLSIPDTSALTAVSDREARRIFQQHAQAYAAYRQGIAAQRGEAVQGGSTQKGAVSNGSGRVSAAPNEAGDRVVLSSGEASDSSRDEQDATQKNISESQARVSQLERNVQSLNQALQMQGEAAKDAVIEGAAAVGQTLSDAASGIGGASDAGGSQSAQAAGSAQAGASDGAAQGGGNAPAGGAASAGSQAGSGTAQAADGQTGGANANGGDPSSAAQDNNTSTSNQAEQSVSWLQENLLGVITAVLALIVLIIAWVLRRASALRSDDGQITEAMVQERLEKIDLDFEKSPADGRPPHTS